MADPRAFISFDFDHDHHEKILFAGQAKHSKTPFNIEDWSSKSHLPQNEWEKLIEEKIKKCNMLIVLVGKYMATATGAVKKFLLLKRTTYRFLAFMSVVPIPQVIYLLDYKETGL